MAKTYEPVDLPIEEHLGYQRRRDHVQSVLWLAMLAFVLAAVAGLFGQGGPLATRHVIHEGVRIDVPRFARHDAPLMIEVEAPAADGPLHLRLRGDWALGVLVDTVVPTPERMRLADGALWLEFAPAEGPRQVRIEARTRAPGTLRGDLQVDGGTPVPLHAMVFP
jgi:hypothetical protein